MEIPATGSFHAFAMIVDINGFTKMVSDGAGDMVAEFVRDSLGGAVQAVEEAGGEVMAFMGDALLGILPDAESTVGACGRIAKDLDRLCEWVSNHQEHWPQLWSFAPGGPSLKLAFECGLIEQATISSRRLGTQNLLVGEPINYASRISGAGEGNRCVCGPKAVNSVRAAFDYRIEGPRLHQSAKPDGPYEYYDIDLGDLWLSGKRVAGEESYLG
jgi:class 3 adenylate cyclase